MFKSKNKLKKNTPQLPWNTQLPQKLEYYTA